jgi:hypothetical protein
VVAYVGSVLVQTTAPSRANGNSRYMPPSLAPTSDKKMRDGRRAAA